MGQWNISINGTGAHHNKNYERDANRLAAKFVAELRAAGHTVASASFTHGGADNVGDEAYLGQRDAIESAPPVTAGTVTTHGSSYIPPGAGR